MRSVLSFILVFFLAFPLVAQEQKVDRSSTGGAQTLEDIMARQKGLSVDDNDRRNSTGGPGSAKGIQINWVPWAVHLIQNYGELYDMDPQMRKVLLTVIWDLY